jgi:7,8-dihydro-6-hydroxymethylpterin-pyrophosphokinase
MTTPRRWLLLLGSSLDQDDRLRTALDCLADLGESQALTPVQRFPSHDGSGRYYNALAEIHFDDERPVLVAALKRLETALGRHRDETATVDIDIDILAATDADGRWRADHHALEKNEFARDTVCELLRQAGIDVAMDNA